MNFQVLTGRPSAQTPEAGLLTLQEQQMKVQLQQSKGTSESKISWACLIAVEYGVFPEMEMKFTAGHTCWFQEGKGESDVQNFEEFPEDLYT
jgi:hypothetical protein